LANILVTTGFPVNLGSPLLPWLSSTTEQNVWDVTPVCFPGPRCLLYQPSNSVKAKHGLFQPVAWLFFIQHRTPDRRDVVPFTQALQQQYRDSPSSIVRSLLWAGVQPTLNSIIHQCPQVEGRSEKERILGVNCVPDANKSSFLSQV